LPWRAAVTETGARVKGPRPIIVPGADYQIRVVGHRPTPLRDFYHALVRAPWWATIGTIAAVFLTANALFALGFLATDGVAHAAHHSFADAFYFSVQTMGTIGYGAMYPRSTAANLLVVAETIVSLTLTALATGLVFAKFSRSTARLVFTHQAVISPVNGVPTLSFRIGNERGNQIVDAQIRALIVRSEKLAEGGVFYRMIDLRLTRERVLSLSRSWTVHHIIDAASPLHHLTPEDVTAQEIELHVMVVGLDDATMQTVHGAHRYFANDIRWGARHVDVLSDQNDGVLLLDLRRFHDLEPTRATAEFPYPRGGEQGERGAS
jgi:inward rectifier potassium channel